MNDKFEYHVSKNYARDEHEQAEDAIYLRVYVDRRDGTHEDVYTAISAKEARDFAAALNHEADAYDEREKVRQEAKKYPTEDGYYVIGSIVYRRTFGVWYGVNNWDQMNAAVKARIDEYGYKRLIVEDGE